MPFRPDKEKYTAKDRTYPNKLTWPEWVTIRRLRLYWTKEDLARFSGVTRMTLWRLEMSQNRPQPLVKRAIEEALDRGERGEFEEELAGVTGAVGTASAVS